MRAFEVASNRVRCGSVVRDLDEIESGAPSSFPPTKQSPDFSSHSRRENDIIDRFLLSSLRIFLFFFFLGHILSRIYRYSICTISYCLSCVIIRYSIVAITIEIQISPITTRCPWSFIILFFNFIPRKNEIDFEEVLFEKVYQCRLKIKVSENFTDRFTRYFQLLFRFRYSPISSSSSSSKVEKLVTQVA